MITQILGLLRAGQADAALTMLRPMLAQGPHPPDLLKLAVNAGIAGGDLDLAWQCFQALREQVTLDEPLARVGSRLANRLGTLREADHQADAAHAFYREAQQLWRDNPDAAANRIRLLGSIADPELLKIDASELPSPTGPWVRSLQAALSGQPPPVIPEAASTISDILTNREHHDPERAFQDAGPLDLRIADALALPMVYRSQSDLDAWRDRYRRGLTHLAETIAIPKANRDGLKQLAWSNFLLAYQGQDDLGLQSRYGDWLAAMTAALRPDLVAPRARRRPGPPRIGLVSGHWYRSTVGSYFASWITALASLPVALDVLALAPNLDDFTAAIVPDPARLLRLDADPDRAAEVISGHDYDLLIYPELGIDTRLMPMAALPLARQQWLAWGHPVTSGLPTLSGFLTPIRMEPDGAEQHYRERLLPLPGIGTAYRKPEAVVPRTRAELGLPEGPLLVCPQSPFKIHPEQDALLIEALDAVPGSRLLLFASERPLALAKLRARLGRAFAESAIDPGRLLVHPMVPRARFLQILGAVDLMLDTRHWSGGNTALDALFMGLPMVGVESAFMRGRQSAAMLRMCGLDFALSVDGEGFGPRVQAVMAAGRTPWADAFATLADGQDALAALRDHVLAGLA